MIIFLNKVLLQSIGPLLGATAAFGFGICINERILKKERNSHINFLLITFHSYKVELKILFEKIEEKLEAVKFLEEFCKRKKILPDNMSEEVLRTRSIDYYTKPLTINTANFAFATNYPDFLISLVKVLSSLEDLTYGLNQTHNSSMLFSEKYKDKEPSLQDFANFLTLTYENHNLLKRKICESVYNIKICKENLKKINENNLKYKLIEIPSIDDLINFVERCQKFVNNNGAENL